MKPLSRTERVITTIIFILLVVALISVAELGRRTARPFVESEPARQEQNDQDQNHQAQTP